MTIWEFIENHREEIDSHIANHLKKHNNPLPNDEERRLWVLNDEALYALARSEGVEL